MFFKVRVGMLAQPAGTRFGAHKLVAVAHFAEHGLALALAFRARHEGIFFFEWLMHGYALAGAS